MSATQLLLIDLSGVAHAIYHVSGNEPDPSYVSNQIVARVRALATAHPHAALCCDSGRSFRHDLFDGYKANRDRENRAPLHHQIAVACERLKTDGFPVWSSVGYEADDVIATATREALALDPDITVLIASADKDLLQLVSDRVSQKKISDGTVLGPDDVIAKFGVTPAQMNDYLCLVGDTSDNIQGAKGIGGVIAGRLLKEHGSLEAVYAAIDKGVVKGITPALRTSLQEFRPRWPLVRDLITLKTDAPIPIAEIGVERTAPALTADEAGAIADTCEEAMTDMGQELTAHLNDPETVSMREEQQPRKLTAPQQDTTAREVLGKSDGAMRGYREAAAEAAARVPQQSLAPVDFSQQLEPRSMPEAKQLAQMMFESRLFSAYGTPQAVLATVLAGRELGIPAMASLRAFHIIEGKPTLSAGTIQSLVLKSGKAHYFRCSERTNERATFVTKRGDDPEFALTYTIEDGRAAWPKDAAAFAKSGWGRNPADMCVARAASKLARLVYPDVVSGLYAPEEVE